MRRLVNINAYHQPGVEAGKKAAEPSLTLQLKILRYLTEKHGHALTSSQIASGIGAHDDYETIFKICEHLRPIPITAFKRPPAKRLSTRLIKSYS